MKPRPQHAIVTKDLETDSWKIAKTPTPLFHFNEMDQINTVFYIWIVFGFNGSFTLCI